MIPGNLVVAVMIFAIGAIGIMWRRDAITIFMCIELMFNAANLGFITLAQSLGKPEGVAVFLFVITIAAAEAAVGLALFIKIFDDRENIEAEKLDLLKR
ncbi:NADH-quinone oxidoreductase subunit NuoK [bacterium]|nr:NADH-quinone oxidoreductase subunit NuoK [bacterium]